MGQLCAPGNNQLKSDPSGKNPPSTSSCKLEIVVLVGCSVTGLSHGENVISGLIMSLAPVRLILNSVSHSVIRLTFEQRRCSSRYKLEHDLAKEHADQPYRHDSSIAPLESTADATSSDYSAFARMAKL